MLIKDIFMELRTRLRSCNVFITTGIDLTKNYNFKINIQSNRLVLNYYHEDYNEDKRKRQDSLSSIESLSDCYSEEDEGNDGATLIIPIGQFCKIIPNSMSCLKIDKNTISFRVLTEPKSGGNFYKELLSGDANEKDSQKTVNKLKINVKVDEEFKVTCANCSNVVSDNLIKFTRILELPTSNIDMSEWFCHGHCHGNSSHDEVVLKPNKSDFLYRLTFFVINNSLLSGKANKFNAKRVVFHCNRCLAWLGVKNKDTVKLFNSEVKINKEQQDQHPFSHETSVENITTDDFIYTIECMAKEFNLGFQYAIMCKLVLECTISVNKKQYLLIWIMDKELQVLRSVDQIECDKIMLTSCLVTKILYKVEYSLNEEVELWLSDPGVVSTEISKGMFMKGLEHLEKMSLKVPESFRNANGYCVSYLKV